MPLTITKLKMWRDPGYTRRCIEAPPVGSKKLPTPDYVLGNDETLRPHKGSTLTDLNLPLSFTQVFEMSYLYIEASDGAGSISLFGWIDSITQRSTSYEGVTISWSVDWWRSYSGSAVFNSGRIMRTSSASLRRPPTYTPRYRVYTKLDPLTDEFGINWVILKVLDSNFIKTLVFPAGSRVFGTVPEVVSATPSLNDCYNGKLAEQLDLAPSAISGVWVCPFCPCNGVVKRTDSGGEYYDMSSAHTGPSKIGTYDNINYTAVWVSNASISAHVTFKAYYEPNMDELTEYGIVDSYGNLRGTFSNGAVDVFKTSPGGAVQFRADIGSTSAYIIAQIYVNKFYPAEPSLASAGGCSVRIPMQAIPVDSNALSEYVYSGQRQYEIESAKIQQDQKFVNNLLGVSEGIISGGVGGAMAGKGPGALIGATVGAGASLASAFITNDTDRIFRDRLQSANDKAHENQISNLTIPSEGMTWSSMLGMPYVVKIEADATSKTEYTNNIALNGYMVDYDVTNVTSYITAGGPIQITNLNINGAIPPQAKQSIKSMLEAGIRIIENNPSGVTP